MRGVASSAKRSSHVEVRQGDGVDFALKPSTIAEEQVDMLAVANNVEGVCSRPCMKCFQTPSHDIVVRCFDYSRINIHISDTASYSHRRTIAHLLDDRNHVRPPPHLPRTPPKLYNTYTHLPHINTHTTSHPPTTTTSPHSRLSACHPINATIRDLQ